MFKLTRECFETECTPANGWTRTEYPDAKAVIYVRKEPNKTLVKAFGGKRSKPDFYYSYRSAEQAEAKINDYLSGQRAQHANKKQREAVPVDAVAVGDIFYSSWGYDQTNVDFYQVIDRPSRCFAVLRKVCQETVRSDTGADYVAAIKDSFLERDNEPMRKRINIWQGKPSFSLTSYSSAYPWDGRPKYATAFGWGH